MSAIGTGNRVHPQNPDKVIFTFTQKVHFKIVKFIKVLHIILKRFKQLQSSGSNVVIPLECVQPCFGRLILLLRIH